MYLVNLVSRSGHFNALIKHYLFDGVLVVDVPPPRVEVLVVGVEPAVEVLILLNTISIFYLSLKI